MNISMEVVRRQLVLVLRAWGLSEAQLAPTVAAMVEADLSGIDSHGISMLPIYDQLQRAGRLNVHAEPRVVRENLVMGLIDGDAGFGHAAATMAMNLAVKKCTAVGLSLVSVFNSNHFGAAGYYAKIAADHGFVGLVSSSTRGTIVVPTFGAAPVLGTNPIAFAAPAKRHPPILFDMATSTVSRFKVASYAMNGLPMPEGWVIDGEGGWVTSAAAALRLFRTGEGGLTPAGATIEHGSHKGYGLALVGHILSATLAGGSFGPLMNKRQQSGEPDNIAHLFLAIDPKMLRPDGAFEADIDELIDVLHATPAAAPNQPVAIPGEARFKTREQRLKDGIPIPAELLAKLREVADRAGAAFLLEPTSAGLSKDPAVE